MESQTAGTKANYGLIAAMLIGLVLIVAVIASEVSSIPKAKEAEAAELAEIEAAEIDRRARDSAIDSLKWQIELEERSLSWDRQAVQREEESYLLAKPERKPLVLLKVEGLRAKEAKRSEEVARLKAELRMLER